MFKALGLLALHLYQLEDWIGFILLVLLGMGREAGSSLVSNKLGFAQATICRIFVDWRGNLLRLRVFVQMVNRPTWRTPCLFLYTSREELRWLLFGVNLFFVVWVARLALWSGLGCACWHDAVLAARGFCRAPSKTAREMREQLQFGNSGCLPVQSR